MTRQQEDRLIDYMNPPKENREKVRALIPELERLVPALVAKWLQEPTSSNNNFDTDSPEVRGSN